MADPLVSVSSALIAIVTATLQSSRALYQTVRSFQNHQRAIKQLLAELSALSGVLQSLEGLASQDDAIFLSLKLPLVQCHQACSEFGALIVQCSKHSGGSRTSFRDWAKLRYMDNDISGFTSMLAGYKSTICIALADANLRSTTVTLQVLNEYKDMIHSTVQDLEDHLDKLQAKLVNCATPTAGHTTAVTAEVQQIRNEQSSAVKCLEICNQVLHRINEMHFQPVTDAQSGGTTSATLMPQSPQYWTQAAAMTLLTLKACSDKLVETMSHLHAMKESAETRSTMQADMRVADPTLDVRSLQDELDSTRQCIAICKGASGRASEVRVHVLENISMGHDGQQLFISTLGDLFNVKGASAGDGAIQFIGSVSDASLQEFFRSQKER